MRWDSMMRKVLRYLPAPVRGLFWTTVSESYAAAARVVGCRTVSVRRRFARAVAGKAAFVIPREAGFKVLPPGQLPQVDGVILAAREMAARFDPDKSKGSRKEQLIELLDMKRLTLDSSFLRFALREEVIAGAAQYLRIVPILLYVGVWYSREIGRETYSSQLYHQDPEGKSQVKIFVLCNDVVMSSGPLTVIGARMSEWVKRASGYRWKCGRLSGRRLADEQVRPITGGADEHVLTGPAGTVCLVDTSRCFHFGSRVRGTEPRIVSMFQFVSPLWFRVSLGQKAPLRHLVSPTLTPLQRLVLGG